MLNRSIETFMFLWQLMMISANYSSSNLDQVADKVAHRESFIQKKVRVIFSPMLSNEILTIFSSGEIKYGSLPYFLSTQQFSFHNKPLNHCRQEHP